MLGNPIVKEMENWDNQGRVPDWGRNVGASPLVYCLINFLVRASLGLCCEWVSKSSNLWFRWDCRGFDWRDGAGCNCGPILKTEEGRAMSIFFSPPYSSCGSKFNISSMWISISYYLFSMIFMSSQHFTSLDTSVLCKSIICMFYLYLFLKWLHLLNIILVIYLFYKFIFYPRRLLAACNIKAIKPSTTSSVLLLHWGPKPIAYSPFFWKILIKLLIL